MMYCLTEQEYLDLKNPIEIQKAYNKKVIDMLDAVNSVFEKHSTQFKRELYFDLRNAVCNITPHSSTDAPPATSDS